MKRIAVIDDRENVGKRLIKPFRRYAASNNLDIEMIYQAPLDELGKYVPWIIENNIVVLIVDEKLQEQCSNGIDRYDGHELATYLRSINQQIPLFIITSYAETDALRQSKGDFEDFIKRTRFSDDKSAKPYLDRIFRAAAVYLEHFEKDYSKLGKLAEKLAIGTITAKEKEALIALRVKLNISNQGGTLNQKEIWVNEVTDKFDKLKKLSEEFERKYNQKK